MRINDNIAALQAYTNLLRTGRSIETSTARLSSGYKINSIADDPAGLAVSKKLKNQINGLTMAARNSLDGVSLVGTAEGALNEVHSMLHRIRELAIQSANDTNEPDDREKMQDEIEQLFQEINDIVYKTEFNTIKVLSGEAQAVPDDPTRTDDFEFQGLRVQIGANKGMTLTVTIPDIRGIVGRAAVEYFPDQLIPMFDLDDPLFDPDAPRIRPASDMELLANGLTGNENIGAFIEDPLYSGRFVSNPDHTSDIYYIEPPSAVPIPMPGIPPTVTHFIIDPTQSHRTFGVNVLTGESAQKVIQFSDRAMANLSSVRSTLGAYENRLRHTENNLNATREHTEAALSRVRDTDMAWEMTKNVQYSIINQAGIAILGQANQRPQQILQLLR
jgi:flagellin